MSTPKVAIFLAEGFEEIEAVAVIDILRRAQIDAHFVSIEAALEVKSARGVMIKADYPLEQMPALEQYQMLIFPGGGGGVDNMRKNQKLMEIVKQYNQLASGQEGRYIAAICAAPDFLAEIGLLEGVYATSYPSFHDSLTKHGAQVKDTLVLEDRHFITSQGPATAMTFAIHLTRLLAGKQTAEKVRSDILLKKISELKQIENLQSIISGYEHVLKLNESEINDLEKLNAMYNTLIDFNRSELIDANESIKASENVRDLSRQELITALDKIKKLEAKIIHLTEKK